MQSSVVSQTHFPRQMVDWKQLLRSRVLSTYGCKFRSCRCNVATSFNQASKAQHQPVKTMRRSPWSSGRPSIVPRCHAAALVRTSQSASESPMHRARDQNGAHALKLFTNLWVCLGHLVSWLCPHSHNACPCIGHNFLRGTCRFNTRKLLMLLTCGCRFIYAVLLLDGAFRQGSWVFRLHAFSS